MKKCKCTYPILTKESINNIASMFNLSFKELREDIFIQGSPERCIIRTVFEDEYGDLYIIENISEEMHANKIRIAKILNFLEKNGLKKISPYIKNKNGETIIKYQETFFQIMPYIKGIDLKRPRFINETWRGKALADFLIDLKEKSKNIDQEVKELNKKEPFLLKNYVFEISETIKEHDMDYYKKVKPIVEYLKQTILNKLNDLKVSFSHGDYHPINVIWGNEQINSVIDWEFCGYKSEIYDTANLIGCIGIENPNALNGKLVESFIKEIKSANLIDYKSWDYMVNYIIANRFAWLSEWFRKKDIEMIDLEIIYMNILIQNKEKITSYWKRL